ncbi:MAG: hypothetical protein ACR2NB_00165 [Solirubrobacteraceae bacterium]
MQLGACGLTPRMVWRAVERGHLHRVHHRVYAVGRPPASPHERAMAAVLAGGPGAVLSHHWSGWIWTLRPLPDGPVEITASRQRHARRKLILHQSRSLPPQDTTTHWGIPTTTAARAVLDMAPTLPPKDLRRAVNDGQIKRFFHAEDMRELTERSPGRATTRLRALVALDQHGATRSLLEDLLLELHRGEDWPPPLINHEVHGVECDFVYPALRLIVEADGYGYHFTRIAFEDDHARRLQLAAAGWRVVAVTYRQLTELREATRAHLRRAYAAACSAQSR